MFGRFPLICAAILAAILVFLAASFGSAAL
jgi:hypothetical protein